MVIDNTFNNRYLPFVDALRGISIMFVVLYHYFPDNFIGGFVGVDVFFVISGYLITKIIIDKQSKNEFTFLDFYKRRLKRIVPALFFMLILLLISGYFFLLADEYKNLSKHILSSLFFASNYVVSSEISYFDISSLRKPLLHLWSLSVEEQFYIFWPLVIFIVNKFKKNIALTTLILILLSFVINVNLSAYTESQAYYMIQSRAWQILAGGFVYVLKIQITEKIKSIISYVSFIILTLSCFLITKQYKYPNYIALLPTVSAALLVLSYTNNYLYSVILKNKLLIYIGLISYPLYLFHWPIVSIARIIETKEPNISYKLILLILTIVLSVFTFEVIEKRKDKITYKMLKAVFLGLLISSLFIMNNNGLQNRFKELETKNSQYQWNINQNADVDCIKRYGDEFGQYCKQSNLSEFPELILLGDSNANHLYSGLSQYYNVLNIGKGACLPFFDIETELNGEKLNCYVTQNKALNLAINQKDVKTIVLAYSGNGYLNQKRSLLNDEKVYISLKDFKNEKDSYSAAMKKTLDALQETNKRIIFIHAIPRLNFDPKSCDNVRPIRFAKKETEECIMKKIIYDEDSSKYFYITIEVLKLYPKIEIINLAKEFCDNNLCSPKIDKNIYYRDEAHLNENGSKYLISRIINKLK